MFTKRKFRKYFEWIGSTIYIKQYGRPTTTQLRTLLNWWVENEYNLEDLPSYTKRQIERLDKDDNEIIEKLDGLYKYLGLEFKKEKNVVRKKKAKK